MGARVSNALPATSSRVIFALDLPSIEQARAMALTVRDAVGMLKVGLELFVEAGPRAAALGQEVGLPVFLDLKLHDIPETVERAVARASQLGARMLTVHASGGRAMLRRAVERARREGAGMEVVAVTVLTSLDADDLASLGAAEADVAAQVERLARLGWEEGVRAFVCSPREAARLRHALGPDATLVTPGVRMLEESGPAREGVRMLEESGPARSSARGDDQKRTMSAGEAISAGASWVVVGRPIRDAADPLAAARAIGHEIDAARERD
jgi:orotidine-5'-phosphate decarboxylase